MKVIHHQYESVKRNGAPLVIDHATGLIWQRSGSISFMTYSEAHGYIELLNREKFAGCSDWRLPTLEEAMSLMEPEKKNGDLYIDPVFDRRQRYIWTADQNTKGVAHVLFNIRIYTFSLRYCNFVRAVRSDSERQIDVRPKKSPWSFLATAKKSFRKYMKQCYGRESFIKGVCNEIKCVDD